MNSSLRKYLLIVLTAMLTVFMSILVAVNVNFASAENGITIPENAERVSGEYVDDFYMEDKASVRIETAGIKFTTVISKTYLQTLESQGSVEFIATAKKVGGTASAVPFKEKLTSETMTGDTYELNTYLNFNEYTGDMAAACAVDFTTETYAKITPAEGEAFYVMAYKPEGNDIARSMQAVANAHYLETGESTIEEYFTVGNRSDNKEGYFFNDNSGFIKMAGLPEITDASDMKVYYKAKQLDATYANGQISFSGITLDAEQTEAYISVFTSGKVYSSKVQQATKITQSNVTDLLSLTGNANVVLTEDVDLAGITWSSTSTTFAGTFDGNGHTIKNLTTQANSGFFKGGDGVTIKNVAFTNVTITGASGALFYQPKAITVDNVFIQITGGTGESGTGRPGAIFERGNYNSPVLIKDTVIYMPGTNSREAIFGYKTTGLAKLTNVHVINLPNEDLSIQTVENTVPNIDSTSTYTFHTDLAAFATAEKSLTPFLNKCAEDYFDIVMITQSNVSDLLSLTGSETVYLAQDIDLAGITWNTTVAFKGTFDGGNHAVKNLTTVSGKGFFATAQGTIKNVAFVNAYTGGNSAVIADKPTATLVLENIFVNVTGKDGWSGATVYNNAGAMFAVNMNNVLVSFSASSTYYNLVGYMLRATSELANVHVISGSGKYAREHAATAGYIKAGSTVTFHTDLAAFNSAEKTLTPFLTSCVSTYLNANA